MRRWGGWFGMERCTDFLSEGEFEGREVGVPEVGGCVLSLSFRPNIVLQTQLYRQLPCLSKSLIQSVFQFLSGHYMHQRVKCHIKE